MTKNTLQYVDIQEKKRHNLATENLTQQEINHKKNELAETIRNNLRNYGINVEKNQITKLANDQLDQREANKLAETIRSNLANESLKLRAQIETENNNARKLELEKELNQIKRMDTLLSAAKATGKTPTAILLSWFTNQANLQAFAGTNNFNEYYQQIKDWLSDGDKTLSNNDQDTNWYVGGGRGGGTRGFSNQNKKVPDAFFGYGEYGQYEARKSKRRNRREENEIPEDYSNSYGPSPLGKFIKEEGGSYENITSKASANDKSGPRVATSKEGNESSNNSQSGYAETRSGEAKVYYSPGTKPSGPGVAFS